MVGTVMVLVNGEVLANGEGSSIAAQRINARHLAEGLLPLFSSENHVIVMHGNKPQVGFVLFRSELASHILHTIPLDVCGADTQGATGYMLSQAFNNLFIRRKLSRKVISLLTQTLVDKDAPGEELPMTSIGPWFDRDKAEQYRQTRAWQIIEEPGRGYRRAVPTYPVKEILEIEVIKSLVETGYVVIAGGGGGVPVVKNPQGNLEGIEAVIETEQLACLMAQEVGAKVLFSVIEADNKFILAGLSTEGYTHLSLEKLDEILAQGEFRSRSVERILKASSRFLHGGGEQVVITTIRKLADTLQHKSGLRIGLVQPSIELFPVEE